MSADARNRSAFGAALEEQFELRQTNQRALASATRVSPSYINHTMAGRKAVSPQWADLVADVLKLSAGERVKLHRAAAKDAGYKLDLTRK